MGKRNDGKREYASPRMVFVRTQLFETVANECWANPALYCLVDPTDEDACGNAAYADLGAFGEIANGCNQKMKDAVWQYLTTHFGTGTGHHLTDEEIYEIMNSGGGNMGTALKTSSYIQRVRS